MYRYLHISWPSIVERRTVTATIKGHVDEEEKRRKELEADCLEKVVHKKGTTMWGRNHRDGK
jgi:hypothetical protein